MSDDEQFYDTEIAPRLLVIAEMCKERGFALVAHVQWELDGSGRTEQTPHGKWPDTRIVQYAARCHGNIDELIMALLRDGKEYGHNSWCLHKLETRAE